MIQTGMKAELAEIVQFLDDELRTREIQDYPNAMNGLQVQNDGTVSKIAMAVDASEKAIMQAVETGADLLIVHHGLFWPGLQPITGCLWRKIDTAIKNNLAVYSSHLPLDIHPLYGNNSRLAFICGLKETGEGFPYLNSKLGIQCQFNGTCAELLEHLKLATGHEITAYMQTSMHESPGKILVCSGGGGDEINLAAQMGANTYITGEGSHWIIPVASEMGINLILAGHYATETFGVKAIGEVLSNKFQVPAAFIPLPPKAYSNQ